MANGTRINGNGVFQPYLITPCPKDNSIYYLFSVSIVDSIGLSFSTIDMRMDNGLGDVVYKNVQNF